MNTAELLEQLTEKYAQRDLLNIEKKRAIPDEVQKVLDDIEAEFSPKAELIGNEIAALESAVKTAVLADGATVKGGALQAVFAKGRVTWDTKSLDGYCKAHPELEEFRKVGDPSVSIRKIG